MEERGRREVIEEVKRYIRRKYKDSKMKDEETPAYKHVFRVGEILEGIKEIPIKVIIAGYLHDAVEDHYANIEEITKKYGGDVSRYVEELTLYHQEGERWKERSEKKIERLREISEYGRIIKVADKIAILEKIIKEIQEGKNPWYIMNSGVEEKEYREYFRKYLRMLENDKAITRHQEIRKKVEEIKKLIRRIW